MPAAHDSNQQSDIEIARAAEIKPITEIAAELHIGTSDLIPYGHSKAKISLDFINRLQGKSHGKLILVTGMTPTRAGEGKTTMTVGLSDALNRIGRQATLCLREPSLGPCFGLKGGAAGGGMSQVVPMEDINLHFTGDFHAISSANNLLAAMIDNHVYWGNEQQLDVRRISWRRVLDMNDRALREITNGLGAVGNGFPRTDGFDITVASEVMAIFCLASDVQDLQRRLGDIIIGQRRDKSAVYARDIRAEGAMTALLKDALQPNLVQTIEGTPAFIHGGPFANIAHGCNSLLATDTALKLSDYVVTEAGFGAELGAEKFFDIKLRKSGLTANAAVIVCTTRALKYQGGCAQARMHEPNSDAMVKGFNNLARHVSNTRKFGVPVVVAINRFSNDRDEELERIIQLCADIQVRAVVCNHWAQGSEGAVELAQLVVDMASSEPQDSTYLYPDDMRLWDKIRTVAQELYGAQGIIANYKVRDQLRDLDAGGYGRLPVCIAKTPFSFSTDPDLRGAPSNHVVPIREIRLSNGAGYIVVLCDDVMTMPGLPRQPAAENIRINPTGEIEGLF